MTKRLLVLILLSASVLVYRGADFVQWLSGVPDASGYGAIDLRDGRIVVTAVPPKDLDGRPSMAARMGLEVGDAVIAFERTGGSRVPITGLNVVGEMMRRLPRQGGATMIVLRRSGAVEREVRLPSPERKLPGPLSAIARVGLTVLLPLLAVGTALLLGFLRPDDGNAFLAGLLFLCFSSLFGMYPWSLPAGIRELAAVVHSILSSLFAYAFMRFFLVFPSPSPIERRVPWLKHVLLVPVLLVAALVISVDLVAGVSLTSAERLASVFRIPAVWVTYVVVFFGMLAVGFASGVWRVVAAPTPDERRRVGIIIAGAAAGLLPMIAIVVYVAATGTMTFAVWMTPIIVVTLPIFPLSFLYVVVRHRVLGVSMAIRRGLQYALMSRGVLVAEGLAVFLALYLGVGPLMVRAFPEAGAGSVATTNAVAAAGAVLGLSHVNRRVKTALDRRYFRDPYNAQQVLADLGTALEAAAAEPGAIAAALARSVAAALHAAYAEVYLGGRLAARVALDPETGMVTAAAAARAAAVAPGAFLERWSAAADGTTVIELDSPMHLRQLARQLASGHRPAQLREELVRAGLDSASVGAALTVRGSRLGWLVLGDKLSEEAYSVEDRDFVRTAAQQAAVALDYSRLIGRVAEQEAMKRELDIARDVQVGLLPRKRPTIDGLDYDGMCRMAREVGGDYFDFLDLGAGRLGLALGDISGKGVSAALLMASLQALLRSRARQLADAPASLVTQVNESLAESTDPSKFATFFYAVFDSSSRALRYVNAGHNPPFLLRTGTTVVSRLRPTGMALGFDAGAVYAEGVETLVPGDLLLAFTDGLSEALNEQGEEFGEARAAGLLVGNRHLAAGDLQRLFIAELEAFCGTARQHDDVTIVVARAV